MRISEIISLLKEYLILGLIAIVFLGILFFIGYNVIYKKALNGKKVISKKKMVLFGISICYVVIVLGAVFFNRGNLYGILNLHLFSSYREAYHKMEVSLFRNIILNILLFVPFGFLLPMYSEKLKKIYKVVPIGFLVTLIIETIQYITKKGIFEVDDIFNNTIGVLIGYCVFMIYNCLVEKVNRKYIVAYIVPIISIMIIPLGMYISYKNQTLGNLEFEYNYIVNMNNVQIQSNVEFSNEISNKSVYYTKILNEQETRKIAENIFKKLGTSVDENSIDLYEDIAIYKALNGRYHIWVEYKDGTYTFTDFSSFNNNGKLATKEKAGREEIISALNEIGIDIPENAEFEEKQNGKYILTINMNKNDENVINGRLQCTYYSDETVKNVDNKICEYEKIMEKEIITEKEAYQEILSGKFQYTDYYIGKIENIIIEKVDIGYYLDSKGYFVPVYVFSTKINGQNNEIKIKAIK